MPADYYKTLGVDRSASTEDIQKAYRKLARKHHPDLADDKEAAKQKFQEIQQAYDVLSDEEKRSLYDRFGPDFEKMAGAGAGPFGGGGGQMDIDLNDLFGSGGPFAGGGSPFGGAGGQGAGLEDILRQFGGGFGQAGPQTQAQPQPQQNLDLEESVTISFHNSVVGGQRQISVKRGSGKVEEFTFKIPAGIENGKKIRLRGQGQTDPRTGKQGDLLIKINVASHPHYWRKDKNLHVKLPITIAEATLGGKIDLPTPHGTIAVTIPPGSASGKTLRLKGMGIKTSSGDGDLIIDLEIVVPTSLTDEQKQSLREIAETMDNPRADLSW